MSLMELFSRGNSGNNEAFEAVTAPATAITDGNSGNVGNSENVVIETKSENKHRIIVSCYTPNGQLIEVEARNDEHAAFLQRMNQNRK